MPHGFVPAPARQQLFETWCALLCVDDRLGHLCLLFRCPCQNCAETFFESGKSADGRIEWFNHFFCVLHRFKSSVYYWGLSIIAGLFVAEGCGKQSGTFHFQSGPDKSPVRSNTIPDFRDITVDFVTIYLWALYLSRFSHLASTGKQFDPTWGLSRFRDVEKRGGWKELDMDQLARTATPRASESWQRVVSCYGVNLAWLNRNALYLESFFLPSYVSCYSGFQSSLDNRV